MCETQLQNYFNFALPLIKEAGQILLKADNIEIETKDEDYDLVTYYDRKVEEVLIEQLKEKYPEHRFIGEEESSKKNSISELTDAPTWIIDPIDGTANFVRNLKITCISVGLTIKKELALGIVYNPYMEELYTAIKGKGAYLNGKRIFTSGVQDIGKACFGYEISLAKVPKFKNMYMYRLKHLISEIQGIRSLGCAVMSLCYVARGGMDAYQCDGLYPWDAAAGVLIVREAGGHVMDSNGKEFNLMDPNFIATASEELTKKFMEIERRADEEMRQNGDL